MIPNSIHRRPVTAPSEAAKIQSVLDVIANGSGEELLNLRELKLSGAHPFSNSTRRRKIKNKAYPEPIKLSSQMCLWRVADIRAWRNDPVGFKNKGAKQ
jgi:predicted DNA-binding transcriptional regulator AlpA